MCGIIGLVKKDGNAVKQVYDGLKRLEYRGYDSAGIAAVDGGKIVCVKRKGGVETLKEDVTRLNGSVAMGHTRWATHGEPSDVNAHPHTSGAVTIVHNGIIENFSTLSEELIRDGEKFASQTDSEVIAKLIDKYYKQNGDLFYAVTRAVKRLVGSFALCVACEHFDGLIAVKYKSSLVLGFSEDGTYIASDIPALPQTVNRVCIPPDGVIAVISPDNTRLYGFDLQPVECVRQGISTGQWVAEKGKYPHFMLKEINEARQTVLDTVDAFFRCGCVNRLEKLCRECERIIITGCGTAYNAGLVAKPFFEKNGVYCNVEIASELRYFPPEVNNKTLVIAVSQSGETADTVEAVNALKNRGAKVVAVTNCGYSAITRIAHAVVPVCARAEICVAATKSYIGQVAALYLLSRISDGCGVAGEELKETALLISDVLSEQQKAEDFAKLCAESRAVFFLGRGSDCGAAVEASLKLKEVSYVFSDAYPAGELKHGTLALIDGETLSVFIICEKTVAEKCVNAVEQVLSRKGKAVVITCIDAVAEELKDKAEIWHIPHTIPKLTPILSAVALQLIAYKAAVMLGRNPDKPRNLAKSVTVE